MTSKKQLILGKRTAASVGTAERFNVEARDGQIIAPPVRIQRGEAVRAKLTELDLNEVDVASAVKWACKTRS